MIATHMIVDRMEMSWHAWHHIGGEWVHQTPDYWSQHYLYVHCHCNKCYCHPPTTLWWEPQLLKWPHQLQLSCSFFTRKLKLGLHSLCRWQHWGKHVPMVVGRWQCNHLHSNWLVGTIHRSQLVSHWCSLCSMVVGCKWKWWLETLMQCIVICPYQYLSWCNHEIRHFQNLL